MQIIVPPSIQAQRLSICHACKYFTKITGSCGTLILGTEVEIESDNEVTHYRKKIHLCGCVMKLKVKFTLASCPAERWGRWSGKDGKANLSQTQVASLKEFLKSIDGKPKILDSEVTILLRWANKISTTYVENTRCDSCVRDILFQVKRAADES